MDSIEYVTGNKSLLDRIQDLWAKLNSHHADLSKYFSTDFLKFTFEDRKSIFEKVTQDDDLFVEIAVNTKSQLDVGYCISSINSENQGEIDSIYIRPEFRNQGIGKVLMKHAIVWLDSKNVNDKSIAVVFGNEKAFEFYSKFGFYPRLTFLKQRSKI